MRKRDSKLRLATATSPRIKKRVRGKPFEKGNTLSLPYRFKKGQSGNPSGRPKCKEISKALRKLLASEVNLPRAGRTYAEQLVAAWIRLGLGGNAAAISAIADRAEGRSAVAISVDGGADPLTELIGSMERIYYQRIGQPMPQEELGDGQTHEARVEEVATEGD